MGHETNRTGQREDESRGFQSSKEGCGKEVARCCDDQQRSRFGASEDFSSRSSSETQGLKLPETKTSSAPRRWKKTGANKNLNLSVPVGAIENYVDLKSSGKSGRIQLLWNRHCGLRLRIDKLEAELYDLERKILQEDSSFFEAKYSLSGFHPFAFRPELKAAKRSGVAVAMRNAIILRASSLTAHQICCRLDSFGCKIPRSWRQDFVGIKTWVQAHRDARCRPRVEKLISEARAQGRLL